jgi:hypothetical protein
MAITDELAQYLNDQGLGLFDPTGATGDIFLETMPDVPDDAVAIYATAGLPPDVRTSIGRPSVQIVVRGGRDPRDAAGRAAQIFTALHKLHAMTFVPGGTWVMLCAAKQSQPIGLGPDENRRYEFSINFSLITGGD